MLTQDMERRLRVALRQSQVREQDGHLRDKDAVRVLRSKAVQQRFSRGKLAGLHLSLCFQEGSVIVQGIACGVCMGQSGDCVG